MKKTINSSGVGDMLQHLNWSSLKDRRKDYRLVSALRPLGPNFGQVGPQK